MNPELTEQGKHRGLQKISPEQLNPDVVRRLPLEFLKKQCAIPIMLANGEIGIALADPLNVEAYDAIVSVLGQPCRRITCPPSEIENAISRCYYQAGHDEENYYSPDAPGYAEPGSNDGARSEDSLPYRRRSAPYADAAETAGQLPLVALEDHGELEHRRASSAAGRPEPGPSRRGIGGHPRLGDSHVRR